MQTFKEYLAQVLSRFKTKGSFTQNLAITFSGNVIAQLLGFILTPFIARIYGPEAYGLFSLFIAITNNLSPLTTLQLPGGYVAARNETEFYNLIRLTILAIFTVLILSLLAIFFFAEPLLELFNAEILKPYLYFIPIYFFFMGADNLLLGWNIRSKEFTRGAVAKIFSVVLSKGITLLWGLLVWPSALGIILGNLMLYPVEASVKLSRSIRQNVGRVLFNFSAKDLWVVFKDYKGYPLFITSGVLIGNLSNHLPIYYLSIEFDATAVGLYALASSLVTLPLSIIIMSSTTVFLQKAAEMKSNQPDELKTMVYGLYNNSYYLSLFGLTIFSLLSERIFVFLFGEAWRMGGEFAGYIALGSFFMMAVLPLSVLFRLFNKERVNFTIQVVSLFIKLAGLGLGVYFRSVQISILGYSLATLLVHFITLVYIFKLVDLSTKKIVFHLVLSLAIFLSICWIGI
ncbi:MAG: oligosaccharide flippase family protein [Cyclobacteriaceae bacterium]|nr:oligosaccharide flippase family protein [Cyclobacteriaceae bacterium]UYN87380.1 MAG: oligosaccharide flippase family protein [Cyclobacteriaceae bacterium]